jgi:hypothetical protein
MSRGQAPPRGLKRLLAWGGSKLLPPYTWKHLDAVIVLVQCLLIGTYCYSGGGFVAGIVGFLIALAIWFNGIGHGRRDAMERVGDLFRQTHTLVTAIPAWMFPRREPTEGEVSQLMEEMERIAREADERHENDS